MKGFSGPESATFGVPQFFSDAKRGAQVLHQQHEVEFKAGAALETVFAVKGGGFNIDGVHQDGTAADDLRTCASTM